MIAIEEGGWGTGGKHEKIKNINWQLQNSNGDKIQHRKYSQ